MGYLLPDARGCRDWWAIVAEVARWEARVCPGMGVFASCMRLPCLMDCVSWCELGACGVLPITYFFSPNIWGLATLTKLKTEMRICCTKFSTVTLVVRHLRGLNGIPFSQNIKCFRGISQYHHFRFTSAPGVIFVKVSPTAEKGEDFIIFETECLSWYSVNQHVKCCYSRRT